MRKKKIIAAIVFAVMSALMFSAPASAHNCPAEGQTNAVFAQHHIVPLATTGGLGEGGHVPGTHQGFAGLCGVLSGG
jgi:hypothetical protein